MPAQQRLSNGGSVSLGWMYPSGLAKRLLLILASLFLVQMVSEADGSGWVQAINVLLGATMLVSFLLTVSLNSRARVRVRSVPQDAQVGEESNFVLECSRPARVLAPGGKVNRGDPGGWRGWRKITVVWIPSKRGVLTEMNIQLLFSGPFSLWELRRRCHLQFDRPILVAPSRGTTLLPMLEESRKGSLEYDDYKVREYVPGDAPRLVSWSLSAHARALVVREPEAGRSICTLNVQLGSHDPETVAQNLMHSGLTVLESGQTLQAITGPGEPVLVPSSIAWGRLLAAVDD